MAENVHTIAQTGFGTGTNELYNRLVDDLCGMYALICSVARCHAPRIRPSYPSESLSYIRQLPKSTAPLNIVEIGAGTGIFTRVLLTHPEWATSIGALRAIEPSVGMRDFWTKTVNDDRATIVEGTFDSTGVEDGWADLIVIAQAFHWCLDHGKALAEFSRILNKDGAVVLIWNLEDREAAGWVAQLCKRRETHENGTPQFRRNLLRQSFSMPGYTSLFHPMDEREWSYNALATEQIVAERQLSWSYISVLPPDEKAKVAEDVKVILERGDGKVWINKEEGTYQYPYKTLVVVSRKK